MLKRKFYTQARRGSVSVVTALCLVAIVAIVAIAVDGGILMGEQRHAQAVADAACLSGAASLYQGKSTSTAISDAQAAAAANGYTSANSTVTVNIPPTSGDHIGQTGYIEVVVTYNQSRSFSSIFSSATMPVQARAVARGLGSAGSNAGLLVLDKTAKGALSATGNGSVNVKSGGIVVDSNSSQAVTITGNGDIVGNTVSITGSGPGYTTTGNGTISASSGGSVQTGQPATSDPLSNLAAPDPNSLTLQSSSQYKVKNSVVLSPGVYIGGISLSGNASVTLQPGIYYLEGGGLSLSGNGSITGQGVMIYNAPQNSSDTISLTGNGSLNLTPPTSGTYQGIAIFQDRNSNAPLSLTGNGGDTLTGTVYAAGASVKLTGNGSCTLGSQYICDTMSLTGNGNLTIDWNGTQPPQQQDIRRIE